CQQETNWIFTF
nr:immunoglobulin light chain junction region [Macaca mulatta]MOX23489.1 immunoglobulin light chain junction region [Macaca mulatta]MOX23492.1 immunoglobulin light chain junction region [Macaca mulatta]MOX23540.1 immunoglobulin light chain junction region [Macaca mulatta]MOX23546.1 immunoglobulin light chain junction region [Macaca mulatta]